LVGIKTMVLSGGIKKDWKREWSVGKGKRKTTLNEIVTKQNNICLNNKNFNINLQNISDGLWCNWQHV
jgi:hypothetical protein